MKLNNLEVFLLASVTVNLCSIVTGDDLTLHKVMKRLVRSKRATDQTDNDNLYCRTPTQVADSLFQSLFQDILYEKPAVDIVILLDSSSDMGESGFNLAKRTLNNLIRTFPREKFLDGTIKISMLTYSISREVTSIVDFDWNMSIYKEMVRRAVSRAEYHYTDVENHGSISLQWAEAAFANSSRYNSHDTTKVLIHATNGHFTDKDYLYKMYRMPVVDAAAYTANRFIEAGYKLFTIVPGTNVDRSTIEAISSQPVTNYVMPVVNLDSLARITDQLKARVRGYRHQTNHQHAESL